MDATVGEFGSVSGWIACSRHMLTKVIVVARSTEFYYIFCFFSDPPEVELEDVVSVLILKTQVWSAVAQW